MSTALEAAGAPALARVRKQSGRRANRTGTLKHAQILNTNATIKNVPPHPPTPLLPPLPAQQRTSWVTPSEQSHVPNRCSCKTNARHAELSRRPRPCCTVVHVHSIEIKITCNGAHKTTKRPQGKQNRNTEARANDQHERNNKHPIPTPPIPAQPWLFDNNQPPANKATFPTEAAAMTQRATLS